MTVSAIIPVKNGEATLARCLQQLRNQKLNASLEIIVIDSGSTDGTLEIARAFDARIISIDPEDFNHGTTRNLGVQQASGEFIYFTVQDAELIDTFTLQRFVNHFDNVEVQAVVGMQAVKKGLETNPAVWFRRATQPVTAALQFTKERFSSLSKQQLMDSIAWDNVNACYRKSALINQPFRTTAFSEDWLWSYDALKAGKLLLRDPGLVVWHYHQLRFYYHYKTMFINHFIFKKHFDLNISFPSFFKLVIRRAGTILKLPIPFVKKIFWILHNGFIFLAEATSWLVFRIGNVIWSKRGFEKLFYKFSKLPPQGKGYDKFNKI